MATIHERKTKKGATYTIQAYLSPDNRKSFGCGRIDDRDAEAVGRHIEHLIRTMQIDDVRSIPAWTAAWVKSIDDNKRSKTC